MRRPPTSATSVTDPGARSVAGAAVGSTVEFAHAARQLALEARRRRLVAPSFRCPPRVVGVHRTIRRHSGGAVIAVQVRGRPWVAVLADMIEGVVAANDLRPPQADRLRSDLWQVVGGAVGVDRRVA